MYSTFEIRFMVAQSKVNKLGLAPLEVSIIVNKERTCLQLPRKISPSNFNAKKQSAVDADVNEYMKAVHARLIQIQTQLTAMGQPISAHKIKAIYKGEAIAKVCELTDHCSKAGWHINKVFANKVSGAKKVEERTEIMEMLEYIQVHDIEKVCVLSIDRLGRNTLEALRVIEMLNDNGVCLFIKNYNLETLTNGKPNPITSLICTILLEISQMERLTIIERMSSGRNQYIARCREQDIKMGRPATYRKTDEKMKEQYSKDIQLLRKKLSLRNIQKITGTSLTTLRKLYKYV